MAQERVPAHPRVEAANERLDHLFVNAGLLLRESDNGGAPLLGAAKLRVHVFSLYNATLHKRLLSFMKGKRPASDSKNPHAL
jgi:hypothetical protein